MTLLWRWLGYLLVLCSGIRWRPHPLGFGVPHTHNRSSHSQLIELIGAFKLEILKMCRNRETEHNRQPVLLLPIRGIIGTLFLQSKFKHIWDSQEGEAQLRGRFCGAHLNAEPFAASMTSVLQMSNHEYSFVSLVWFCSIISHEALRCGGVQWVLDYIMFLMQFRLNPN